ncbi:CPBP family intramembrane metalloprotease [Aestuariimicrobium sp. p3-SID1156]|uniref:CPBP family intramembrane glutamic endopeptidase n=1 Tax=Aestuariimicrobium sp. p3-SID1156 TaxID=2916038 RepID=UPI00223C46F2|nr:CPBP family intramembrane glutamic endopeptidase [Aestuariimicrobium sp. p3-SID1156]MCT1460381.1 CPBP family intramembrane metalloprotease [Aestuariimicrobium sp. p3-SID1156]
MKDLAQRRPVLSFLALAYVGSWLGWSPWWLSESGVGVLPFRLPFEGIALVNQAGLFAGPFAAALVMTRVLEGPGRPRAFLARAFSFRGRRAAYLGALLAVPLVVATPYLVLADGTPEGLRASMLATTLATYLTYLAGGPIQEEPGWRGFALPRMQRSMHPLAAAVGLGVVHTFWHAPLFLTQEWDTARSDVGQFAAYVLLIVALSIVLSWVFNTSEGSSVPAILAHNSLNWGLLLAGNMLGAPVENTWPAALTMAALAGVILGLTRGRLAYDTP